MLSKFENIKQMIFVLFIGMIVICAGLFMNFRIRVVFNSIVESQVKEHAASLSELFSEKIHYEFNELTRLASILERNPDSYEDLQLLNLNGAENVNILKMKDRSGMSMEMLNSFRGLNSVSYSAVDGLIFSVPVFNQGNVSSVLYRKFSDSKLKESFSLDCYEGNGIACVIKSDGNIAIPFSGKNVQLMQVYESEEIKRAFASIRQKMVLSSSSAVHFKCKNLWFYLFESEIKDSDFRILGLIDDYHVYRKFVKIHILLLWVFGGMLGFMVIGIWFVMFAENKTKVADKEKIEALAKSDAKGAFLASMSHEIRTPLNAIIGLNDIISKESTEKTVREYSEQIGRSSETLLSIINDILDFSKIESGKMRIQNAPYHLHSVINDVSSMIVGKARSKNLSFKTNIDYTLPDELLGDEVRIKQILINLLNNSVKYTERGIVCLHVSGTRNEDELSLHIIIKDTGIGISKENIPFLFDSFSRVDEERNRFIEGTGLGLAIVKQLTDMMDGTIKVRSAYGVGSEFEVIIPQKIMGNITLEEAGSIDIATGEKQMKFSAPDAKVVIVDDNEVNLLVAEKLLTQTGMHISSFADPFAAMYFLKAQKVDVMLIDDLMPKMNGVELLKNLRVSGSANEETPAVALTANAMAGSREKYLAAGFDSYLSKPVTQQTLCRTIYELLPENEVQMEIVDTSSAQETAAHPVEQYVDSKLGLYYCAGSADVYKVICDKYIEGAVARRQRIKDAFLNKEWNDLMIEVHSLKSSSLSIGAKKLSEDAAAMEQTLRAVNEGTDVAANIAHVEKDMDGLLNLYDGVVEEVLKQK